MLKVTELCKPHVSLLQATDVPSTQASVVTPRTVSKVAPPHRENVAVPEKSAIHVKVCMG